MSIKVSNPLTGEHLYEFEELKTAQLNEIFNKATKVQGRIASMPIRDRINEVVKISKYLIDHYEVIVDKVVSETGKTRFEALSNELFEICDNIDYYRDHAEKILQSKKVHTPLVLMGKKSKIQFEPMGVVLIIAPWNYPLIQCFLPSILAFLAGNAVVYKPSEVTPLKGLYEEILEGSGFMRDAIQIVYGGKETGAALIECKPDKIHFTGSTRAGKLIMAAAAKNLIPVDLELGGKDPAIVFEDVDIEKTANGLVWAAFTNAGQSCTSLERCYIHESIFEDMKNMIVTITEKLRLTDPKTGNVDSDVGCMTADFQLKKVEAQIKEAMEKGAKIHCGGTAIPETMLMPPTVISEVTEEMDIVKEETFGPVLPLIKFTTEEEVIELANNSEYGLSASVWSKDLKRADRVASALKVGNVAINNHMLTEANPALPFGGIKNSGFGRYKGDFGLHTFSNVKSIISGPNNKVIEPHWYPFTKNKFDTFPKMMKAFFSRPRKWIQFALVGLKLDSMGNKEKIKLDV
jgi:acyl-CoA reductase-like NAD-dependent aldehyde dehydrogenase